MSSRCLRVHLGERSYDIAISTGTLAEVGSFARERARGSSAVVVTDTNAAGHANVVQGSLEKSGYRTALAVRPPGEAQKSLDTARELYDALVDLSADRRTLVVAVGGGVVGDLAGF